MVTKIHEDALFKRFQRVIDNAEAKHIEGLVSSDSDDFIV
jgi:hypothetical protein